MRLGIWVLLLLGSWLVIAAEETPKTAHSVLDKHLIALELTGPLSELDVLVHGTSIFDPPPLPPGLNPSERASELFRFAERSFTPWDAQVAVGLRELIYGYGFGFCGEQARFLGNLWRFAGIDTRVVSLPNHVMIEALVDGKWQLYDPQHRVDFSALFGKPMSFEDVVAAKLPDGIDNVGYSWSYLQSIYRRAPPKYTPSPAYMAPPRLSLGAGQTLTIRPRESGVYYPLPIVYKRRPDYQTNLLNYYLVEIEQRFSETRPQGRFLKKLPILSVTFEGKPLEILVDGEARQEEMLDEVLIGKTAEVIVRMAPGGSFRITHALAGWIGERLFSAGPGAVLQVAATEQPTAPLLRYQAPPDLSLGPIRIEADGVAPGRHRVSLDLVWSDLSFQKPRDFEVVLDEQETGLLMEYLAHVGKVPFRWDPAIHGKTGKQTLTFAWTPKAEKTERVPYENRLLLAHLIGPGLVTGHSFQTVAFRDKARP